MRGGVELEVELEQDPLKVIEATMTYALNAVEAGHTAQAIDALDQAITLIDELPPARKNNAVKRFRASCEQRLDSLRLEQIMAEPSLKERHDKLTQAVHLALDANKAGNTSQAIGAYKEAITQIDEIPSQLKDGNVMNLRKRCKKRLDSLRLEKILAEKAEPPPDIINTGIYPSNLITASEMTFPQYGGPYKKGPH